jgi:hypothetical protein
VLSDPSSNRTTTVMTSKCATLHALASTWLADSRVPVSTRLESKETEHMVRRTAAELFVKVVDAANYVQSVACTGNDGGPVPATSSRLSDPDKSLPAAVSIVAQQPSLAHIADACVAPTNADLAALYVRDPEGEAFWAHWSRYRVAVSFTELFDGLERRLGMPLSPLLKENLKFVLNDAGCNLLTVYRFGDFLKGFGPGLASAVTRMQLALEVGARKHVHNCVCLVVPPNSL